MRVNAEAPTMHLSPDPVWAITHMISRTTKEAALLPSPSPCVITRLDVIRVHLGRDGQE
jgi:hypothetical protein